MTTLYLDTETFSECDLKTAGTHAYAAHPSTEITVAQWAFDDDEPVVVDYSSSEVTNWVAAEALKSTLREIAGENPRNITIVVHNSAFDRTVIRHVWGIDIPVERWHDTMVQSMAHGLPGSLEKVGMILGLPVDEQKDKRGKQLIRLFCKPLPKNSKLRRATRETHPAEWAEFLEYSRQDIVSMRAIHKKLPEWNYRRVTGTPGYRELQLWQLDQRINDRGFAVDVDLATRALATAERCRADLREQVQDATDGQVSSATKRDQLLAYLLAEYGVTLPDMTADTLKRRMDDPALPEGVKLLLAIRLEASMASSSKYKALLAAVSADDRLRNTMQFAGAQRTARWAGRIFQPQNMKRPDPDMTGEVVAELIDAAKADVLDLVHPEPMRALANIVRGCIVAPEGKKLVIADLSNIEGRMLAWLAGESWKLTAFREFDAGKGADLYRVAYGRAFNIDPHTVDKNQRQIGKVQELALGYQGGVGAFLTFAAVYNMDLGELARAVQGTADGAAWHEASRMYDWTVKKHRSTFGLPRDTWIACQVLVTAWREAHANVVALWTTAEAAMHMAILHPGTPHRVGEHIRVQRDGAWTRVRLPSGRCLCYLHLQNDNGQLTYAGVNQYTRQWGRIKTYGGKLVENWTQAAARDVLGHNMPEVEQQGYEIVLSVHDELLTETPDSDAYSSDALAAIMATNPPWANGLPLAAAGFETYRYRKD